MPRSSDKGRRIIPIGTWALIPARAETGGGHVGNGPRHDCQVGGRRRRVGPSGGNDR
jgi:hypothetical protein